MEMDPSGSVGCKVEVVVVVVVVVVVEKAELDIDEWVGEGGRLNIVRVELGLAGKGESSTSRTSRPSEIGCGSASEMKKAKLKAPE